MRKSFLKVGAISGALAVMLGAFGAHFLKGELTDKMLAAFETGVRYQMYHTLALIAVAVIHERMEEKLLRRAGRLFMAGIVLFSGSLYIMAFMNMGHSEAVTWPGVFTPVGGICFILGWLFMLFAFLM